MSATYYKERCEILEKENATLKEALRKSKKQEMKRHDPNCDGDLWICEQCRPRKK